MYDQIKTTRKLGMKLPPIYGGAADILSKVTGMTDNNWD